MNWTTILVGWRGLGVLSPWPDHWEGFPPLLSTEELSEFALERLELSTGPKESDITARFVSLNLKEERREAILSLLTPLSDLAHGDAALELRKWRLVLLSQALKNLPKDPLYGLIGLTEFWNEFGFPPDSPHTVQGVGNSIGPSEYYTQENLDRMLSRHLEWIEREREAIDVASAGCAIS